MSSPYQKKQKRLKRRRKPNRTRQQTPDDPAFWARRGWPSAALNGKDEPGQTPQKEEEGVDTVLKEESPTLRQTLRRMFSFDPTYDEFAPKNIVTSIIAVSAMLAGAFYFAKWVMKIMHND